MMPKRVIRQPNGKLALFSTIVDTLLEYNCTPDEMTIALVIGYEFSRMEAEKKVRDGLEDLKPWTRVSGSGTDRWDYDVPTIIYRALTEGDIDDTWVCLYECGMTDADINALVQEKRADIEAEFNQ
jgi:hypothetical protein